MPATDTVVLLLLGLGLVVASVGAARARAPRAVGWGLQALWVLFLLEGALRLSGAEAPWMPPGAAPPVPEAGRDVRERAGIGRSDSLFRGPPTDSAAPHILLVGDSFTEGQGVAEADALPAQLAWALGERGTPARLSSIAVSGENIDGEAVLFEILGQPQAPGTVVQVWVLNDLYLPVGGDTFDFINDHRGAQPRSAWRSFDTIDQLLTLRRVTEEMTTAYRQSYRPGTPASDEGKGYLDILGARGQAAGARMVLVIFPLLTQLDAYPFAEAHAHVAALATAAGYEVVDLLPVFAGRDARELWVHPADQHPNAAGHRLAAEAIAQALARGPLPTAPQWGCTPPLTGARIPDAAVPLLAARCARPEDPDVLVDLAAAFLDDQATTGSTHWARHAGVAFIAAWDLATAQGDTAALDRLRALRASHRDRDW